MWCTWMHGGCETEEGALAGVSLNFRERKVKSAVLIILIIVLSWYSIV